MDVEKLNRFWMMIENELGGRNLRSLLQYYGLTKKDWFEMEEIFDKLIIKDWRKIDD